MSDEEARIRRELERPAPAPEPFTSAVMSALYRARARRQLLARSAAIVLGMAALSIGAPVIAAVLERAPAALSTGAVGLLLLASAMSLAGNRLRRRG